MGPLDPSFGLGAVGVDSEVATLNRTHNLDVE